MSGSNPTSRYFTGASGNTDPFHSAEGRTSNTDGGVSGGGSGASVSLAPLAWAGRLFGAPADQRGSLPEDDDLVEQGSLNAVESLRESSVVVRPVAPPLDNAAATPRFCADASEVASPERLPLSARRYTAGVETTPRPAVPVAPPPPEASPLAQASFLLYGHPGAAAALAAAHTQQHQQQGDFTQTAPPTAPLQPHAGQPGGWLRQQAPGALPPAVAAVGPLSSITWGTSSTTTDPSSMAAAKQQLPLPPTYAPPTTASMARYPTSQQQLLPAEAAAYGGEQPSEGSGDGKPSPTKSIDASAFHLNAYAGSTTAVEQAAAQIGSQTQAGQRPSRTAALRQRHQRQLRQQDRDQYGVPVASTARPFSLWASPQKIGEACTGLGVYFASVKQFIIAALLLSLVALYPLVSNLTSQNWSDAYTLKVDKGPTYSCNKGWDTSSWVTGSTAGSRCSSAAYSSSFDCPAVCSWTAVRLSSSPQCAGLAPPALPPGSRGANATCLLHPPCSSGSGGSTDPSAPDGPCYCCDLQLDSSFQGTSSDSAGTVPPAQLWVFFLGQLLFLSWVLFLTRAQLHAAHVADARVITASDFTVVIQGVPHTVADSELREWCSHYGSVVATYSIPDMGDAIGVAQHLQTLLVRRAEADAWLASSSCGCSYCCFNLVALGATTRLRLQRQLDASACKLRCYERQDLRATGMALVVFEYAEHAANMIEDHHRPMARRLLDATLCGATATAPRLASRRVRVRRAPEPSDILWQHTACTGSAAITRRLLSATLTLLIIAAGAGLQYGLAVAAETERKNKMSTLYSYDSDVTGSLDFSSWAAFTASALQVTKLNAISILSGLAVVLVNWLVTVAVRQLTVLERWHTRTAGERWALLKLSFSYLTNGFVVPLLAAYFAGSSNSWYSRGGLLESAFYMQMANALLPPLAMLCDVEDIFYYCIASRWARTQAMTNRLLEPPGFLLAEQYASALKTLGVAICWMPVLPVSPYIAALGLFLAYWADKIVALRRAAHPGNMRGKLVSSASLLIRLLPLAQLLLMRFLYFRDEGGMVAVFWTGLAVWLLFAIAPIRALLGLVPRRRSTVTGGLSYQETLGSGLRQGQDDHYAAELPPCISLAYQQQVAAVFQALPTPQQANETLLPRQKPALGGAATRPPFRPDKSEDRAIARAAASLRARQQATLSVSASLSGRQGSDALCGADAPQQPGSSRLARGLSAVKDSLSGGASWLRNTQNPDNLFSYDWRTASQDASLATVAGPSGAAATHAPRQQQQPHPGQQLPGMSPFQPMGKAMRGSGAEMA